MPSLPRLYHPDQSLVQWGDRLIAKIVGGELGGLELTNILYVDVNGVNATAQRGNIDKPYATVAAALADAQTGDVIHVGPGLFTEPTIVWPGELSVKLIGSGPYLSAIVEETGAGPAISHVPGALETTQVLTISNIRISNDDPAAYALNIDGSASSTSLRDVHLDNVLVTNSGGDGGLRVAAAERVLFSKILTPNNVLLEEVREGIVNSLEAANYAIDFDVAQVHTGERGSIAHTACLIEAELSVSNVAWAAFGSECAVRSIVGALTDDAVDNEYGIIDYRGRVATTVAITFDYQDSDHQGVIFDYASIGEAFSVADSGGAGTERMRAKARHAIFRTQTDQTVNAGDLCDLDIRGALFDQETLVVAGSGAIDRSVWTQLRGAAAAILPETLAFANTGGPIPYPIQVGGGNYTYTIAFEITAAPDVPLVPTAKNANGQDFTYDGAATPNLQGDVWITVTRPFDRYG